MEESSTITPSEFCVALIAQLVLKDVKSISPRNNMDIKGFHAILKTIDKVLAEEESEFGKASIEWRELLRIRNRLSPSNMGSFDKLESMLLDLQTSLVLLDYDSYTFLFSFPEEYAQSIIEYLPTRFQNITKHAVEAFLKQTKRLK